MLQFELVKSDDEIDQILALQSQNLKANLTPEEVDSEGYVTVHHDFDILKKMHNVCPSIICKDEKQVVGYSIAMTKSFSRDIPVLVPMFEKMDDLVYKNQGLKDVNYMVCGQVCISKGFRSKNIFSRMCHFFKDSYSSEFPFLMTEIASDNLRSLAAHRKVGFEEVLRYPGEGDFDWVIVLWDWTNV